MNYITVKLTEDQVKAIIYATNAMRNTYKSIVKRSPNDCEAEKAEVTYYYRLNNKLFKALGL